MLVLIRKCLLFCVERLVAVKVLLLQHWRMKFIVSIIILLSLLTMTRYCSLIKAKKVMR